MNQPKRHGQRLVMLLITVVAMVSLLSMMLLIQQDDIDDETKRLAQSVLTQLEGHNEALLALKNQIQSDSELTRRTVNSSAISGLLQGDDERSSEVAVSVQPGTDVVITGEPIRSRYVLDLENRLKSLDSAYRATYLSVVSRFGYVFEELDLDPKMAGNLIDAIAASLFELENMRLAYQAGEVSREDYITLTSDLVPGRIIRSELSPEKFQEYIELRLSEEMEVFARAIYGEMYEFTPGLDIPSRDRIAMAYTAMTWQLPAPQNGQGGLEATIRYRNQYIQEVVMPEIRKMVGSELSGDQLQEVINYLDHKSLQLEQVNRAVGGN